MADDELATIGQRIRKHLRDYVDPDVLAQLSDDDSLLEGEVITSFAMIEMILGLEAEFGIRITDEDVVPENLDSLARMVAFVEQKLG